MGERVLREIWICICIVLVTISKVIWGKGWYVKFVFLLVHVWPIWKVNGGGIVIFKIWNLYFRKVNGGIVICEIWASKGFRCSTGSDLSLIASSPTKQQTTVEIPI